MLIGTFDQCFGSHRQIGAKRSERLGDLARCQHVRQAVRAQQIDIAGLDLMFVHFGMQHVVDTDRASNQILILGKLGPFSADQSGVDLLLQQRMIARDLFQLATAKTIGARIADMRQRYLVMVKKRQYQRGAHTSELRFF